jgi:hypothetical protein
MGLSNYLPNSRISQAGVCTSATRPVSPYEGQVIYETDTNRIYNWNGSDWVEVIQLYGSVLPERNKIINGGLDVWQRGTSITISSGGAYVFAPDRFSFSHNFNQPRLVSRVANNSIIDGNIPQHIGTMSIPSAAGSGTEHRIRTRIENPYLFSGKTMTFSFYMRFSATTTITFRPAIFSNSTTELVSTGDMFRVVDSSEVNNWVRYSFTFEVPDLSLYAQLGGDSFLQLFLRFSSVSSSPLPVSFWGFQLEEGLNPTPFAVKTTASELIDCQRYCQAYGSLPLAVSADDDYATNSASFSFPIMRTIPTAATTSITFEGHGVFTPSVSIGNGSIRFDTSGAAYRSIGARGIVNGLLLTAEL